jgi:hypothetical protein
MVLVLSPLSPFSQTLLGTRCRPNVMARRLHRILSCFVQSAFASAAKWTGPSSTDRSKHSYVTGASLATEAPSLGTRAPVDIPSTYEAPHVCGYVNFDLSMRNLLGTSWTLNAKFGLDNPYTCANSNTCLWNSHLRIVGCGNPTAINYITSCIPYRDLDDCDDDCFANPSIIRW